MFSLQSPLGTSPEVQEDSDPWYFPRSQSDPRSGLAVGGSRRGQRTERKSHRDPGLVGGKSKIRSIHHLGHRGQESVPGGIRRTGRSKGKLRKRENRKDVFSGFRRLLQKEKILTVREMAKFEKASLLREEKKY